ncbi:MULTISPECIES: CPBP family intramembrane glutamic endopeptidase [Sphingomonas]|nr:MULTISPECIES: CPBP family intramembrane glutamic endopeptidase [Sphingomonas]MBA2920531.1 CPBP family intramembrane metalloprotease [Sphingomonas sp. CGMCC 1.13658]
MAEARNPATKAAAILPVAVLVAAVIIFIVQWGFGRLVQSPSFALWSAAAQESAFTGTLFGLLALAAGLGLWLNDGRVAAGRMPSLGFPAGAALGILGLWLSIELSAIAGALGGGTQQSGASLLLIGGTIVTLFQTSVEELYFRGWLQPVLQSGWGRWPGLAATAIAFAALHFVSGDFHPISLLNLFLGGLWFGLLADKSGGLLLPIGAHFGWNWAEEMLFGVAPNPGSGSFGSLLDWELGGSPLWGGSAEGLNSSVSASFALAALIAATLGWRPSPNLSARRG